MLLPVEWAFGAGRQAVTFVTRVNEDWYLEHAVSYYPLIKFFGVTPGQDVLRPKSIQEAAGVLYALNDPSKGIQGCFLCHSTGPVTFSSAGVASVTEHGVRCEACHGPAADHVRQPSGGQSLSLHEKTGEEISTLCGKCHRPPAQPDEKVDWNYAWNVRHQPMYLNQSRCFQRSSGRLSCVTCHEPHAAAGTDKLATYNRVCQSCHQSGEHAAVESNCVDCHMPRVSPQPALRFTNHWIGIYLDGSRLRPIR